MIEIQYTVYVNDNDIIIIDYLPLCITAILTIVHKIIVIVRFSLKTCPFFSRMRKAKHAKTKLIKKIYMNS